MGLITDDDFLRVVSKLRGNCVFNGDYARADILEYGLKRFKSLVEAETKADEQTHEN